MAAGQGVQQAALEPFPRGAVVVVADLFAHGFLQGFHALQAETLGEGIVERQLFAHLDRLDGGLEDCRLALQVGRRIVVGKVDLDADLVTRLGAQQLLLEAGDEGLAAQHQFVILAAAAVKEFAVDGAGEIDHRGIAVGGQPPLFLGIDALGLGQAVDGKFDLGLAGLGLETFELELGKVGGDDCWQHLDRDGVFEIAAGLEFGDLDLGLQRRFQLVLGQRLLGAQVDRVLEHLAGHGVAVFLAHQPHRYLAGAEPGQLRRGGKLLQPGRDLGLDLGGRDNDSELTLESVGSGLCYLHQALVGISEGSRSPNGALRLAV